MNHLRKIGPWYGLASRPKIDKDDDDYDDSDDSDDGDGTDESCEEGPKVRLHPWVSDGGWLLDNLRPGVSLWPSSLPYQTILCHAKTYKTIPSLKYQIIPWKGEEISYDLVSATDHLQHNQWLTFAQSIAIQKGTKCCSVKYCKVLLWKNAKCCSRKWYEVLLDIKKLQSVASAVWRCQWLTPSLT